MKKVSFRSTALALTLFACCVSAPTVLAQQCTSDKQESLDSCAIGALQDCYGSVGGNCEQRYATTGNAVGRFKEVCCCKGQQIATKSVFAACKSKTVEALADLKVVLGSFATRTRSEIKALGYGTCTGFPCDEF